MGKDSLALDIMLFVVAGRRLSAAAADGFSGYYSISGSTISWLDEFSLSSDCLLDDYWYENALLVELLISYPYGTDLSKLSALVVPGLYVESKRITELSTLLFSSIDFNFNEFFNKI